MIKKVIGKDQCAIIDERDSHLLDRKWFLTNHGYVVFNAFEKTILLHRAILGSPLNGLEIDHIDGNKLNNQRENLRLVTHRVNSQNLSYHRGEKKKSSKYVGVRWCKTGKKWRADIQIDGKNKYLGYYATEKLAALAYKKELVLCQ